MTSRPLHMWFLQPFLPLSVHRTPMHPSRSSLHETLMASFGPALDATQLGGYGDQKPQGQPCGGCHVGESHSSDLVNAWTLPLPMGAHLAAALPFCQLSKAK